jgi:hypothetical protein
VTGGTRLEAFLARRGVRWRPAGSGSGDLARRHHHGEPTIPARRAKLASGAVKKTVRAPAPDAGGHVVPLTVEHFLASASRRFLPERPDHCVKCGSTFIGHEPAFVHCRYCGKISRIANAPLAAQELFELRSGLRIAS